MNKICTKHNVEFREYKYKSGENIGQPYLGHWLAQEKAMCFAPKDEVSSTLKPISNGEESQVDWDAKDRQSMAQTAMKSASEVVAAIIMVSGKDGYVTGETEVKRMANEFYKEIRKMKTMVNQPEDLDNRPDVKI